MAEKQVFHQMQYLLWK